MELGNMIFGNSRGEYPLDRDNYQDIVCQGLEDIGCDYYGVLYDSKLEKFKNHRGGISTELFETYPYWWGDEESDEALVSNFIFKPTRYEIQWYKYALRDAYANQDLDPEEVEDIFRQCRNYLEGMSE